MTSLPDTPLLDKVKLPKDLKTIEDRDLPQLAREVRDEMIDAVSKTGGHLGAGLGVVELTIAIHKVFETPEDRLIFDVGHQCYPHKILTGRRDSIHTVKKKDGVAPFPKRDESEYDTFGVGHSSTSISAALGMAVALQRKGDPRQVVAVIGDGAMTAGMAYEALNHAGGMDPEPNLLVILNDNRMSISENVGGLTKMLGRMMSSRTMNAMREGGKKLLGDKRTSAPARFVRRWEEGFKVVAGVKPKSRETPLMFLVRRIYYRTIGRLSEVKQIQNFTGFGLYDRAVVDAVKALGDPYPYFRGLIADLGYEHAEVAYEQPRRVRGLSKNNFYTLYDMAMLGITSHSKLPLRLATMAGFGLSAMSLLVALGYLLFKVTFWNQLSFGMAPILIGFFFFASVQLFFIGILGEYIATIHTQVLNRPLVVERERINFPDQKPMQVTEREPGARESRQC